MPAANPPCRTLWLMTAIVLVDLNLRPSVAIVGPLLSAVFGEVTFSSGDISLLTVLPVLTLGLGIFFGLDIARHVDGWHSVTLAPLLIGAASALHLGSRGLPDLLGNVMLTGLGITLTQALILALIKVRFSARTPLYMRLYITAIMAGAALSANAAPTLAEHAGRRFGLGTTCYICVLAWLTPYYLKRGRSAQESGLLLGSLAAMEVLSGLLTPALTSRSQGRHPVLAGLTALMLASFLGLAWTPASLPLPWAPCLGLDIGGLPPMGLIVCLDHFSAPQRVGQLTALVQDTGYLIAGVLPWVAGLLRDSLSNSISAQLGLTAVAVLLLGLGLRFDPWRYVALSAERQTRDASTENLR